MTLQQLHYAIVISETGSMNKAAERLYISQPSLTGANREIPPSRKDQRNSGMEEFITEKTINFQ